jgi:WD40 repeat protein
LGAENCGNGDGNCGAPYPTYNADGTVWYWNYRDGSTGTDLDSLTSRARLACPSLEGKFSSHIVIDLEGKNFEDAFTSLSDGILWDFLGHGIVEQMAWTNPKRKIGFLVLDRPNKGFRVVPGTLGQPPNGKIDNGHELFGDATYQPFSQEEAERLDLEAKALQAKGLPVPHWQPNGFEALAFFDRTEAGGNNDGKISSEDEVWSRLQVWVDTAHDGNSLDGQMYTLDELGIKSISLKYVSSPRKDKNGNQLRFQGTLEMAKPGAHVPNIYDVFFVTQ